MSGRLSVQGRMVTTTVAAAGVALAVLVLLARPPLDRRARDDAFGVLTAEARLVARVNSHSQRRFTSASPPA